MKRRLVLLIGSAAALLLIFGFYHLATRDIDQQWRTLHSVRPAGGTSAGVKPEPTSAPTQPAGEEFRLELRDAQDGRLNGIVECRQWQGQPNGSMLLFEPRATLFQNEGQQVTVRADRGEMTIETIAKKARIQNGRLWDNVQIEIDPRTLGDRQPGVSQNKDSLIHIEVVDLTFNNEMLQLRTDERVAVRSAQADVFGEGLDIRWNEKPRELRELRLIKGERMVIRQTGKQDDWQFLPGGKPGVSNTTISPSRKDRPSANLPARPAPPSTSTASAASAPTRRKSAGGKTRQFYVVTLTDAAGNLRVDSEKGTISNAELLEVVFSPNNRDKEAASPARNGLSLLGGSPMRGAPLTTLYYVDGRDGLMSSDELFVPSATASAPQDSTSEPTQTPTIITWDGPLTIRPLGPNVSPPAGGQSLRAAGQKILLEEKAEQLASGAPANQDKPMRAICQELYFDPNLKSGYLAGTSSPATLTLPEGVITSPKMTFDNTSDEAILAGPGNILHPAGNGMALLASTQPDRSDSRDSRITWGDSVVVQFGRKDSSDKPYIRKATFKGNVAVEEKQDSDWVTLLQCQKLDALMALTDADRKIYLSQAVATGNVTARQEKTQMNADRLDLTMLPLPTTAPNLSANAKIYPNKLHAWGSPAWLKDQSDPQNPVQVFAYHIESDLTVVDNKPFVRNAWLYGDPTATTQNAVGTDRSQGQPAAPVGVASVSQGNNTLTGMKIFLDQESKTASVASPGTVLFEADSDMDGQKLDKPRLVTVNWPDSMTFKDSENTLTFVGSARNPVTIKSETETTQCRTLTLLLDPEEPTIKPVATSGSSKKTAIGMQSLRKRKLRQITAKDDVVMSSERRDDQHRLLQWVQVKGQTLSYDKALDRVEIIGEGLMALQDYRSPEPENAEQDTKTSGKPMGLTGKLQRPSQTVFTWNKSMVWTRGTDKRHEVVFAGKSDPKHMVGVTVKHYSGDQLLQKDELRKQLNLPEWGKLPAGRSTVLGCQNLKATFDNVDASSTSSKAATESMPGMLTFFKAWDDVTITDGPAQIGAYCVEYNRSKDLLELLGHEEGATKTLASLVYEDPKTLRSMPVKAEYIRCMITKDGQIMRVDTPSIQGRSAR